MYQQLTTAQFPFSQLSFSTLLTENPVKREKSNKQLSKQLVSYMGPEPKCLVPCPKTIKIHTQARMQARTHARTHTLITHSFALSDILLHYE